ncbi:hypothetical protein D3C79_1113910 [compost metagenome]
MMIRIIAPTASVMKPINGSKYAASPPTKISCPSKKTGRPILAYVNAGNSFLVSFAKPMTRGNNTSAKLL